MNPNTAYRRKGYPSGDPEIDARRREHYSFHALCDVLAEAAGLPPRSPALDMARQRVARAKAAWWQAVRDLDRRIGA